MHSKKQNIKIKIYPKADEAIEYLFESQCVVPLYLSVKNHCHDTDKYRGTTCIICNLIYIKPKEVSVFFSMDRTKIIILS